MFEAFTQATIGSRTHSSRVEEAALRSARKTDAFFRLRALKEAIAGLGRGFVEGALRDEELLALARRLAPEASWRITGDHGAPQRAEVAGPTGGGWALDHAGARLVFAEKPVEVDVALCLAIFVEAARARGPGSSWGEADDVAPLSVAKLGPEEASEGFVAASPSMRALRAEIAALASSRATVIIRGESGSGKELVARAVHDASTRSARPFVTLNCAAVPRELFESQLFGHKRGAFTGATSDALGVLRAADGGTVFLDEIGELPIDVQPKLLRFLENAEVLPVGANRTQTVDVRVVAATHRDLLKRVAEGAFREDLYYRLQVIPLVIPPLRERPEDVVAIARSFLRRYASPGQPATALAPDAVSKLMAHAWPGNVRELRNVIDRAMAFEPRPATLRAEHLRLARP